MLTKKMKCCEDKEILNDSKEELVKDFFPATTDQFVSSCGEIVSVKRVDFLDENRRKHLTSFKSSWDEWESFNERNKKKPTPEIDEFVEYLIKQNPSNKNEFKQQMAIVRKKLKIAPSISEMILSNENYKLVNNVSSTVLDLFLIKKTVRTHSGVVVITILTSPGSFSCQHDCYYCPNEPGQPRSYLSTEPAVLRANQNGWDAATQFWNRAETLHNNGHLIDKIEILVLGGTWSGYPASYQEKFIRDIFYAANVFPLVVNKRSNLPRSTEEAAIPFSPNDIRDRRSLKEEQLENQTATNRIIGLTLETRPDHITMSEVKRLRQFGCTRVQIGIQHTDDNVLNKVNRNCTRKQAINAICLLKDTCFKVDIHLMLDLPGSSPALDKTMLEDVLSDESLQVDQWKIYPCEVTPFSKIEEWYKNKQFIPYSEHNLLALVELIVKVKTAVHPWIRLNRIIRDIPNPSIIAGNKFTNLRQILNSCMSQYGLICRCIRCREIKNRNLQDSNAHLKIRKYSTNGGTEFFLSYETEDESTLLGFLRLRIRHTDIPSNALDISEKKKKYSCFFPELDNCGLIRELHIYGMVVGSEEKKKKNDNRTQHSGIGKTLLYTAEVITLSYGLHKMAVIAGVGTICYYRKLGYEIEKHYMTKIINESLLKKQINQFNICLPLTIQVYQLDTDLGHLKSSNEIIHDLQNQVVTASVISEAIHLFEKAPIKSTCQRKDMLTYHFKLSNTYHQLICPKYIKYIVWSISICYFFCIYRKLKHGRFFWR